MPGGREETLRRKLIGTFLAQGTVAYLVLFWVAIARLDDTTRIMRDLDGLGFPLTTIFFARRVRTGSSLPAARGCRFERHCQRMAASNRQPVECASDMAYAIPNRQIGSPITPRWERGGDEIRGVGEPPLLAFIPSLANAFYAATGRRVREIPMRG